MLEAAEKRSILAVAVLNVQFIKLGAFRFNVVTKRAMLRSEVLPIKVICFELLSSTTNCNESPPRIGLKRQ